jgi:argininosuccinate lyase
MYQRFKEQVKALFDLMMESAENIKMFCWLYPFTNRDAFLFWHVVSAYAESLIDDITMLNAALTVVDQNPLGSAVTEVRSRSTEPLPQRIGLRNPEIQCRCGANESRKSEKILAFAM